MSSEDGAADAPWSAEEAPAVNLAGSDSAQARPEVDAASGEIENLRIALRSNRRIGIAIGLIMAQCHATDHEAFELLRQRSMDTNRKMADLAERVVQVGRLESAEPPPG